MRVLLLEDEKKIADFVVKGLEAEGIEVDHCENGDDALHMAGDSEYDALIFDIMVPGRDGISVLKRIRRDGNATPVILLTARDDLEDRITGLDAGADDYIAKPFYVEELVARLRACFRRSSPEAGHQLRYGPYVMDRVEHSLRCNGVCVELTRREFELLEYMMRSPNRTFSRVQILQHVWGYHFDPATNVVDACIKRLRRKVDVESEPSLFEAVRGVGYRLNPELVR